MRSASSGKPYRIPQWRGGNVGVVSPDSASDWPTGVSAPARRALAAADYTELRQLAGVPATQLKQLHGMGPKALGLLQKALEEQGMSLA